MHKIIFIHLFIHLIISKQPAWFRDELPICFRDEQPIWSGDLRVPPQRSRVTAALACHRSASRQGLCSKLAVRSETKLAVRSESKLAVRPESKLAVLPESKLAGCKYDFCGFLKIFDSFLMIFDSFLMIFEDFNDKIIRNFWLFFMI